MAWILLEQLIMLAYIDPGSGSLAIQILIAGFLGFAYTVRTYWANIRASVVRVFKREP